MKIQKISIATWIFLLILLGAFAVRLYKIDNPVADWHAWRQADTASVARSFYQEGYNPFIPKFDDMSALSELAPGKVNLERYRFVEFPIYNSLVYFGYLLNGGVDERIARLVSVLFSLGSLTFVYLLTRKYAGVLSGLCSAFFFAFLPFNIFFSRVILPEPALVFFSLGTLYFLDRWIWENKLWQYLVGFLFIALALLIKPYAAFYGLALIYSFIKKEKKLFPIPLRYFLLLPAVIPFGLWRIWILQHPEGIPASSWLLNGNGIRFRPAFWRWIVGDRLTREILSGLGIGLLMLGVVLKPVEKLGYFLHWVLFSALLFLVVFATGNVQHDYYQTFIIPALCIFLGIGLAALLQGRSFLIPRLFSIPLAFFITGLLFYLTWIEVKGLYQINNMSHVTAGRRADQVLPKDAVVVAPNMGDTAFLYQINRPGFPMVLKPLKEMMDEYGVTHYVSVNYDDKTNWLAKKYTVLDRTKEFIIIDLTNESSESASLGDREPL